MLFEAAQIFAGPGQTGLPFSVVLRNKMGDEADAL
jgi:hypothetical protein